MTMALSVFYVVLPLLLFATTVTSAPSVCNLSKKDPEVVNVDLSEESNFEFKIIGLDKPVGLKCTWNVSQAMAKSAIYFSHNILDAKDSFEIVYLGSANAVFNVTGSISAGILPLQAPVYLITLTLELNPTMHDRVLSAVLYADSNKIEVPSTEGSFEFPKHVDVEGYSFTIQPSQSLIESKLAIIFEHLPASYSFKMGGNTYNAKQAPPKVYMPDTRNITFELLDWTKAINDTVRVSFWTVIANCSRTFNLEANSSAEPILIPNVEYRKSRQLSTVSCNTLFNFNQSSNGQSLMLAFDVDNMPDSGLANPGDQIQVMAFGKDLVATDVVLGKQNLKSKYYFYHADQLVVNYYSFYINEKAVNFTPPTVQIAKQGGYLGEATTDKKLTTVIDMSKEDKTVVTVKAANQTHRVVAWLVGAKDGLSRLPEGLTMKVYSVESPQAEALFTFGAPIASLPSRMPSSTAYIRIEFENTKKNAVDPFTLAFGAIEPNRFDCFSSSVWSSSFELNRTLGDDDVCTWLLPAEEEKGLFAMALNYVSLPADTWLEMITLKSDSYDTKTLFNGPKSGSYLPDVMLQASNAYEFRLHAKKPQNASVVFEASKRANYLKVTSETTDLVGNFKSPNYPGAYPVNVDRGFAFGANKSLNTLLTWLDVDLAKDHSLTVIIKGPPVNVEGWNEQTTTDMLLPSTFLISLNASVFNANDDKIAGRGFNVDLSYYSCGSEITLANSAASFNFTWKNSKIDPASPKCLWTIVDPNGKAKEYGDRVLEFNVSLSESLKDTNAELMVMDTISMRPNLRHSANGSIIDKAGTFKTSLKNAIIIYDMSKALASKKDLSISFTVKSEECIKTDYKLNKCLGHDRCITHWMACNGLNDCGDWSDEIHCSGSKPVPPPPVIINSGVNGWVVVLVLMPLGALMGILGYIFIPVLMQRLRQGRYSEFRSDFSDVN